MKKIFHFRRSVIVTWVLSYIVILAISVMINMAASANMAKALKTEIYSVTSSLLQQTQSSVDARLNDIKKISQLIGSNANVERFLYSNDDPYPANEYNRIMADLRSYQASNSLITQIYVFMHNKESVIMTNSVLNGALYRQVEKQYTLADGESISSLFDERYYNEFMLLKETPPHGQPTSTIALIQSLPVSSPNRLDATLMISVDRNSLLANLNVGNWLKDNLIYILDDSNEVIATNSSTAMPDAVRYDALENQLNTFDVSIGKEAYTALQTTSSVNDWKYVVLIPNQILLEEFNNTRRMVWLSAILAIALGFIFAILLTRKNYFPLRSLMNKFENEAGIAFSHQENEFEFIEKAVSTTISEQHEMSHTLSRQLKNLRSHFFARLIKNNLTAGVSPEDALRVYDVNFISDRFLVMLIYIREINGNDLGYDERQKERNAKFVIANIFEEVVNQERCGFVFDIDDMQAMLVNLSPAGTVKKECDAIQRLVKDRIAYIEQMFHITLSVTSSECVSSIGQLPGAYTNAYTAMEYCILMSMSGLHSHQEVEFGMAGGDTYHYYYPLQVEVQFTNFIKSGDYDNAKNILDEFFHMNFEKNALPQPIARCFMFNLTSTIMKTIYELNLSSVEKFKDGINAIEALLNCQSITEIKMEVNRILIDLCEYTRKKDASKSFIEETKAFIDKNYADLNLNIPMIADHLSITSSYLSKKFKSCVGIGLLDYINKTRVGKAMEMLRNTTESIANIAFQCGFVNSNTFIRVFKKYEGITPGKYRSITPPDAQP